MNKISRIINTFRGMGIAALALISFDAMAIRGVQATGSKKSFSRGGYGKRKDTLAPIKRGGVLPSALVSSKKKQSNLSNRRGKGKDALAPIKRGGVLPSALVSSKKKQLDLSNRRGRGKGVAAPIKRGKMNQSKDAKVKGALAQTGRRQSGLNNRPSAVKGVLARVGMKKQSNGMSRFRSQGKKQKV